MDGEQESDLHVVLIEPRIAWNAGNAGRTCLALGARLHLVGPLGFSVDDRRARRAGLDYWPRVDLAVWSDWDRFAADGPLRDAPRAACWWFSGEAERDLWHADLDAHLPVVLLFGSETEGLPGPLRAEHGDRLVRLPMRPGSVRALNLSTAVAVAGYEVERRRRRGRHG